MSRPCINCGIAVHPDEQLVADGLVLHRWCASQVAIDIIRALRRELGLFRKPRRRQAS